MEVDIHELKQIAIGILIFLAIITVILIVIASLIKNQNDWLESADEIDNIGN